MTPPPGGRRHQGVIRADPVTGDRVLVTDDLTGSGRHFCDQRSAVAESAASSIVGDTCMQCFCIFGCCVNAIPDRLAVEVDGSLVLLDSYDVGSHFAAVIRVDPAIGDRRVVSQYSPPPP